MWRASIAALTILQGRISAETGALQISSNFLRYYIEYASIGEILILLSLTTLCFYFCVCGIFLDFEKAVFAAVIFFLTFAPH